MSANISALKAFVGFLVWFFVVQPSACYFVILLGMATVDIDIDLGSDDKLTTGTRVLRAMVSLCKKPWAWWVFSLVVVFSSYSVSPMYGWDLMSFGNAKNYLYMIYSFATVVGFMLTYTVVVWVLINCSSGKRQDDNTFTA